MLTFDLKKMHHAQCFVGDVSDITVQVKKSLQAKDTVNYNLDVLTIDVAKEISRITSSKAGDGSPTIIVLVFNSATNEAQNALLKAFEEPAAGVSFICVIPNENILLPTLTSRLTIEHVSSEKTPRLDNAISIEQFMEQSLSERITFIEKITKNKKQKFTRSQLSNFLNDVKDYIERNDSKNFTNVLSEIYQLKLYAELPGCSIKIILERLGMILPVLKTA